MRSLLDKKGDPQYGPSEASWWKETQVVKTGLSPVSREGGLMARRKHRGGKKRY